MRTKERKLAVLHQLSKEIEPINLPLLLKKLGADYVDRSVRRWLSQMIEEGLVSKIGHKRGTKYRLTCAMYDSTVKAIGYDEIRVRYRQQRRAIIRDIILNPLTAEAMKQYVSAQVLKVAKTEEQASLFEDIMEDLKEMDSSRIVGLGITSDQLDKWMASQFKTSE